MDTATQLALQRTELAIERTHLAWVRTGFAFISASVAIDRAVLLDVFGTAESYALWRWGALTMSVFLCVATTILLTIATRQYWHQRKALGLQGGSHGTHWPTILLAVVVIMLGIAASALMLIA